MSDTAKQDIRGWKVLKPMPQGGVWCHGCCKIDDHHMIILGGMNAARDILASGMIYDARTELWTPLPNDMPEHLSDFGIAGNNKYVFVIEGMTAYSKSTNTVYRLLLETFEWTTMAPLGTARYKLAAVRKGDCIYVFGGYYYSLLRSAGTAGLKSVERYSILNNTWRSLSDMEEGRAGYRAVAGSGDDIYIIGRCSYYNNDSLEILDTASLVWKTEGTQRKIQRKISEWKHAIAVLLKNQYLVMIGGYDNDNSEVCADCLIFDIWSHNWSVTPSSIDMITPCYLFTAAVLDGKVIVAGGLDGRDQVLSSAECIDIDDLLEYAPLHYPLPSLVFDRILEIGKADDDRGDACDVDEAPCKKARTIQSNC